MRCWRKNASILLTQKMERGWGVCTRRVRTPLSPALHFPPAQPYTCSQRSLDLCLCRFDAERHRILREEVGSE